MCTRHPQQLGYETPHSARLLLLRLLCLLLELLRLDLLLQQPHALAEGVTLRLRPHLSSVSAQGAGRQTSANATRLGHCIEHEVSDITPEHEVSFWCGDSLQRPIAGAE